MKFVRPHLVAVYFITNFYTTGEEGGKEVNKDSFLSTRQSHPSGFLVKIRNFNGK